ncbi:hypothetical protein [Xanthomonas sp. XNM01]|uniref:hypothetical protein n=1 Tax=Xanthomonas sp. XNM01 TaxID=2769289 RepID=UPI00177C0D1B|nr:hypothetical protein [Xanthomonas sp. XNM01]MBD9368871.1 hypothetical protein [Xanthomonas sp. XNM01]
MATEKTRKLHYKRATLLSTGQPVSLEQMLVAAMAARSDVEQREEAVGLDRQTTRVISGVGASNNMRVGRLMQFTKGQKQHYLEKDAATGDYKLDAAAVPGEDGETKREFVESLTFFAVSAEHVMYIATLHLGSKALEDHLNWLLRECGLIQPDDYLLLVDLQSQDAEQRLNRRHVDRVTIGSELDFEVVEKVATQRRTSERETIRGYKKVVPVGPMAEMLGPIFGDWFGDVPLQQALGKNERVKVTVDLRYSNRKKSDEGFVLMQRLAVAGRHFDPGETRIHLHKGGTLAGSDLKVFSDISVRVLDSGLVDEFDLWGRVNAWLLQAIRTGIVH